MTNASQPASRAPSACPASACPVSATIGNVPRALVALQPPRRLPAVHSRQRQIHQDDVGQQLARLLDGLHAVGRLGHLEARELQVRGVHLARVLIVLDHEHERCSAGRQLIVGLAFAGRRSVKVDPAARALAARSSRPASVPGGGRSTDRDRCRRSRGPASCRAAGNPRTPWPGPLRGMPMPVSRHGNRDLPAFASYELTIVTDPWA